MGSWMKVMNVYSWTVMAMALEIPCRLKKAAIQNPHGLAMETIAMMRIRS